MMDTLDQLQKESRYWRRVGLVAWHFMTIYRLLPTYIGHLWEALKELFDNAWPVMLMLAMPFLFWLAPLWLWMIDREARKDGHGEEQ